MSIVWGAIQQVPSSLLRSYLSRPWAWRSLVEGDEGSYMPNCQSSLVIVLHAMTLLFCDFKTTTAYLWTDTSLHLPLAVALPTSGL